MSEQKPGLVSRWNRVRWQAGRAASEQERCALQIEWLSPLFVLIAVFSALLSLFWAWQVGTWLLVYPALLCGVGAASFGIGRSLARRNKTQQAANLIVLMAMGLIPLFVLFLKGLWLSFAIGALGIGGGLAGLLWPRRRAMWGWIGGSVSAAATLVIDQVAFWPRYDATDNVVMQVLYGGLIGVAVLAILIEVWHFYQSVNTIRTRMLFAFVGVVALMGLLLNVSFIYLGLRNARRQALDQLESLNVLKEQQIESWLRDLQFDMDAMLTEAYDIQRARIVSLWIELSNPRDAQRSLRQRFRQEIERTHRFDEIFLLNLQGKVVLSTDEKMENTLHDQAAFFQQGSVRMYVHPFSDEPVWGGFVLLIAEPVTDATGEKVGVLVGRANLSRLEQIMAERAGLSDKGQTYLVSREGVFVTAAWDSDRILNGQSEGILQATHSNLNGTAAYNDYRRVAVLGAYRWMPDIGAAMLVEDEQSEINRAVWGTLLVNVGIGIGAVVLAVIASILFSRNLTDPLYNLAAVATRIAAGEHHLEAKIERDDEIGALGRAFNTMTAQLREMIDSLELRVNERTHSLQAAAQVSQAIVSVLDIDRLLPEVVELVREQFALYYVGLFLVDEEKGEATLRAATGQAGQTMLAQGWRLPIGGNSMIGQCIATARPGVMQHQGDVAAHFDNPLLPNTRSELALPLRYGQRVIGAMTVQSDQESAFDETLIATLQNVADQVAVAVQNARLFSESRSALQRAQAAQQRYQGQAWEEYLRVRTTTGYERVGQALTPLGGQLLPEVQQVLAEGPAVLLNDRSVLLVPLKEGNRLVGVLGFERDQVAASRWSAEQVSLIEALAEQLSLAAENQRLIDETQGRAAQEQIARQITDRMRRAVGWDDLMQIALREMTSVLGASQSFVQWVAPQDSSESVS